MANKSYRRVLFKLSGEALSGDQSCGIDPKQLDRFAVDIANVQQMGIEIALVIGGGNLFRGTELTAAGMDRVAGDHMGMLATIMNGLAMRDALERISVATRIMSAISMNGIVEDYDRRKAIRYMAEGDVVIFTAGTGNPFFTTDTSACLRGIEVQVEVVFKATKVDGVYDKDPLLYPDASKYNNLTYADVLQQGLKVMDMTAISLARDNQLSIRVISLLEAGGLVAAIQDHHKGTLISNT